MDGHHWTNNLANPQCGWGFVVFVFPRGCGDQIRIFLLPPANPTRVKDYVAVDHFAGDGVRPQVRHGEGDGGRDPTERAVIDILGIKIVLIILPTDTQRIAEADLLEGFIPFQNTRFHIGAIFVRNGIFNPPHDLFFRGRKLGIGIGLFQPPTIDPPHERRVGIGRAKIFGGAQEIPHALIGQPRAIAVIRHLHEAVMQHHRDASRIDITIIAVATSSKSTATESHLNLKFQIAGISLDFKPACPRTVDTPRRQVGKVRKKDIVQINQDTTAGRVVADNGQRHQHRIRVVLLDGFFQGRSLGGFVAQVFTNQLHPVTDALERDDPLLVEIERQPRRGRTASNRHRGKERFVEIAPFQHRIEVLIFFIKIEQAFVLLGPFGHLAEFFELRRFLGLRRTWGLGPSITGE